MSGLLDQVVRSAAEGGVDLAALGLGWARAAPAATLVPAFGLRAAPVALRVVLGLALGAVIAPALAVRTDLPWTVALLGEVWRGIPVALGAAAALWAATMAGNLADDLRGHREAVAFPAVEAGAQPLGVVLSLLASLLFLGSGGPSRLAAALAAAPPVGGDAALGVALLLVRSLEVAVAIAAPLAVVAVVAEVALALMARAAAPASIQGVLAPLRSVAVLVAVGLTLDRMLALLALLPG